MPGEYELSVFINCPFDRAYRKLFHAVVFTVHDCGYIARSALEISDTSQVRIDKILRVISECGIGLHDISRTELDPKSRLPRFNMPLELGMFLGAKAYGTRRQKRKLCLVLDRSPHRYQRFCSDIAGQDISVHGRNVARAIGAVRDFLRSAAPARVIILGGAKIHQRYQRFAQELPAMARELGQTKENLTFRDYTWFVSVWLKEHAVPKA
ncbi:MAG: hypothetical protein H0X40_09325 [Chthoniobacterales bacterium]|nr:hypothetical protein [Chthoniobacterales bacterium]